VGFAPVFTSKIGSADLNRKFFVEKKGSGRRIYFLDPDYAQFSIATPYPGTQLYRMAEGQGLIVEDEWSEYTVLKPILATKEFTTDELEKSLFEAYKQFYTRPKHFFKQIKKGHMNVVVQTLRFILSSLKLRACTCVRAL
jgi:radical SAM superfamily enzyme YgiQ (UPF0313 family)